MNAIRTNIVPQEASTSAKDNMFLLVEWTVLVQHVYDRDWPDEEDARFAGGIGRDRDRLDVVEHLALVSHATPVRMSYNFLSNGNVSSSLDVRMFVIVF